jgi:hypothetical protein
VDSRFTYEVDGTRADTGTVIDSTEKLSFDYLNPGIRFPGSSIRPDVPGSLSFEYDDAAMRANGSTGALLIHHMNASGSRSEVVAISAERPFDLAVAGPSRVTEGRRITFAADVTNGFSDPLSFSWDLGDGDGFSTPGSSVAITPADGPSSIRLKLRATGASTPVLANRDLNVVNVAPRARVRNFGSRPRRLLLSATDPSRADTRAGFRYSVDFGADGSVERRPRGRSVRLAWPAGRRASVVRVTATDKDGASSRPVRLRRPALRVCRVPRLRGLAISRARARLGRANCRLGRVRRSAGRATGRFLVVSQSLRPGTVRAAGTRVAVTLRRR